MIRRSGRLALIGLLLIGVLFFNLGAQALAMEEPDTVIIKWDDNGKTVNLKEGQVVQLSLTANSGTGYDWFFTQSPQDDILKYITHYTQTEGNLPGSGVTENWFFYGLAPGKTALGLKYARSWEPKAVKTFTVNLVISKSGATGETKR